MAYQGTDRGRAITAEGLARLFATLSPDVEIAGREYDRLRRTLVRFFDWRGVTWAEECADETLDRLARKLESSAIDDLFAFARGIARMILLERRRLPEARSIEEMTRELPDVPPQPADPETERVESCLDRCLDRLDEETRALLLEYYASDGRERIAGRRRLAARTGLSDAALRSRVHRLRERIERCVRTCAAGKESEEMP